MNIKPSDLIHASQRFAPPIVGRQQKDDKLVSDIVGKPVAATDPRLIKMVVKYKAGQGNKDEKAPDDYLKDPKFIKELKTTFNPQT